MGNRFCKSQQLKQPVFNGKLNGGEADSCLAAAEGIGKSGFTPCQPEARPAVEQIRVRIPIRVTGTRDASPAKAKSLKQCKEAVPCLG